MSTTALAAPIRVNTAGVHARPGLGRLVAVELRKMVDTRAGFWLQVAMVALTAVVVVVRLVVGDAADHTFQSVLDVGLQPAAVLLPVLGILLVTSEWSQRTGLITFALVPVRSRVLGAKLIASLLLAVAMLAISVAVVAADAGTTLSCNVTATGRGGTATAIGTGKLVPAAPTLVTAPVITGTARPGHILTCKRGTWTGASTFTQTWLRDGSPVSTGTSYTPVAADVGHVFVCRVTATGPGGSLTVDTAGVTIQP